MLRRFLICGVLLALAGALEQGLPIWVSVPVYPSCLQLLLVLYCQSLRGGELVAWAGAVGLCHDEMTGQLPGWGVMTAASLGVLVAGRSTAAETAFADRLLQGAVLLLALATLRGVGGSVNSLSAGWEAVWLPILHQSAATFLVFLLISCGWAGSRLLGRRTYRLENSCV